MEKQDTLKFEGHKEGDVIKAYDFEPRQPWVENGKLIVPKDRYVIGRIKAIETKPTGAKGYLIDVMHDSAHEEGFRTEVFVPMQVLFSEFDNRVTKLSDFSTK